MKPITGAGASVSRERAGQRAVVDVSGWPSETVPYTDKARWHELRGRDVTSTQTAALFGLSPYNTAFEIAQQKLAAIRGEFDRWAGNERTAWGNLLERVIAERVGHVYGVQVRPMKQYMRRTDAPMGASFDYEIIGVTDARIDDERLRVLFGAHGVGVLEIKNVDARVFSSSWTTDGEPEAPEHIEIQVQHQLHVCGYGWACIAALVGGNTLEIIPRLRDAEMGAALQARIEKFWLDLGAGILPPIELPADADIIRKMHAYAEPGKLLDAREDAEIAALCAEYAEAGNAAKVAEDRRKSAAAQLLQRIGDAERVLVKGYTISAGMVAPAHVEYERAGYRNLRITKKAAKAAAE